MHAVVEQTKTRSEWPARRTLRALGIGPSSYYRWLRQEAWASEVQDGSPFRPVQAYEALEEEKEAVRGYACRHTELRHRELAWRMIDEDVAYVSPSTVYRILREANLVCPWRRRTKRRREELEKAQRPNERWGTDLMYLRIGTGQYYLVTFLDEYSRYLVHWELLTDMGGVSVGLAAQTALDKEQNSWEGTRSVRPRFAATTAAATSRASSGRCWSRGLAHQRIKPHCPEENGLVERSNRTLREALEETEFTNRQQAEDVLAKIIGWYNGQRLHRALGYLRPVDYYRGQPDELHEARRQKLARARHRRRERNLHLKQPTLPLEDPPPSNPHRFVPLPLKHFSHYR